MTAVAMGSVSGRVIPPLTVRMARTSNPRGTAAMWVRDRLDGLFTDGDFADWYPADGRRGPSPAQLALGPVLQYAENLTDPQAADAVRCHLDWKHRLGLELDDPGFDFTVLSEFRDRVAEGDRADRLLAPFVDRPAEAGLVRRLYRPDRVDRAIRRVGSPRGAGCGYQAAAVSWFASLRRPAPHDDSAAD
ncbi:transposase [Streptomyces avermitilis]|uniref:transposase n=1 Tax=Streptomyces avermitilis TaxID=33903 RepID=UPI003F541D04